jgi:hypothetical protein
LDFAKNLLLPVKPEILEFCASIVSEILVAQINTVLTARSKVVHVMKLADFPDITVMDTNLGTGTSRQT